MADDIPSAHCLSLSSPSNKIDVGELYSLFPVAHFVRRANLNTTRCMCKCVCT